VFGFHLHHEDDLAETVGDEADKQTVQDAISQGFHMMAVRYLRAQADSRHVGTTMAV
jgi:hypothetical protein